MDGCLIGDSSRAAAETMKQVAGIQGFGVDAMHDERRRTQHESMQSAGTGRYSRYRCRKDEVRVGESGVAPSCLSTAVFWGGNRDLLSIAC